MSAQPIESDKRNIFDVVYIMDRSKNLTCRKVEALQKQTIFSRLPGFNAVNRITICLKYDYVNCKMQSAFQFSPQSRHIQPEKHCRLFPVTPCKPEYLIYMILLKLFQAPVLFYRTRTGRH
jgi:hypothetical protein